jgi:Nucleotidyl transferase AbiEii toxin, Type IV TA system
MKKPAEVMPAATASLLARLRDEPLLRGFTLIGGTALSLHLGHRISEDLDFLFPGPKLPTEVLKVLTTKLSGEGYVVQRDDDPCAYDEFQNDGMSLHEYSQSFVINGEVKLTFFTADAHQKKLLAQSGEEGFSIASLEEIFGLNALVAANRSKSRDWLDLYLLCRDHGFTLGQWHSVYETAGYGESHFERALNRIVSGVISPIDPGFESLLEKPPTTAEIASFFEEKRRVYETKEAARALGEKPSGSDG